MIDAVLLIALVVGAGAHFTLAERLDWLRRTGRAPDAPSMARFFAWEGAWFATSSAHRRLNDRPTTVLVWISRTALCVLLLAGLANLWRA